jgi:short-subunit dehydrogenase
MSLNQQIVLVIGGSSGVGYEIARQTRAQGAELIIVGRSREKLEAAAKNLGAPVRAAVLDAHDERALKDFFAKLETADHVVSMIGDSMAGGFLTTSPETMRHFCIPSFGRTG